MMLQGFGASRICEGVAMRDDNRPKAGSPENSSVERRGETLQNAGLHDEALNPRSMMWVVAETAGNAALLLGVMLLMARLAGAREFALAALMIGVVQLLNLFVEGFFHDALIQDPNVTDGTFYEALRVVLCIAAVIVLLLLGAALVVQGEHSRAVWLLLGAGVSLPFSGALGIMNARSRRYFRHRDVARASLAGRIVGALAGISVAALGFGAWALVTQFCVGVVANTLLLYLRSDWRPQRQEQPGSVGKLIRFALPNAAMHTVAAVRIQGFAMAVTALLGLTVAGYVNVAFRLTTTPQMILGVALMNFSFPALVRSHADKIQLKRTLHSITRIVTTVALPLFGGLAITATELVPLTLGPGWTDVVALVQLLSIAALLSFIRLPGSFLLRSLGHVRFSFINATVQAVITLGGLALFRPADATTAVLLWIAPQLIPFILTALVVRRFSGISVADQLSGTLPAAMACLLMIAAVIACSSLHPEGSEFWTFLIKFIVGSSAYAVALAAFDHDLRSRITQYLKTRRPH